MKKFKQTKEVEAIFKFKKTKRLRFTKKMKVEMRRWRTLMRENEAMIIDSMRNDN